MRQHKLYERRVRFIPDFLKLGRFSSVVIVSLFMLFALIVSACNSTSPANTSADAASQSPTSPQTSVVNSPPRYSVKVYFSRLPQSNNDFNAVFPVKRISPSTSVGTFAIQQLVAGPTAAEKASGYESELKNHLNGVSNCAAAADFILKLNTKGSTNVPGTATLKFCRLFSSAGIGTDARATAEIDATLKQFTTIKKVVILTNDSHCFGDESGADMCLR